jgi:multidrug efflux system outer membrane protein
VYALSAGLTQPIFHGGALRGQVAYSKARYTELLTTYHKTVITAFSNVEGALVAAQQTQEQLERQQEAVAKARAPLTSRRTQMSAGTVNILTVLNTENALFSAQDVGTGAIRASAGAGGFVHRARRRLASRVR